MGVNLGVPAKKLAKPTEELVAFGKTRRLKPGETQRHGRMGDAEKKGVGGL